MPISDLEDLRAQLDTNLGTERPTPQAPDEGTATGQVPVQAVG